MEVSAATTQPALPGGQNQSNDVAPPASEPALTTTLVDRAELARLRLHADPSLFKQCGMLQARVEKLTNEVECLTSQATSNQSSISRLTSQATSNQSSISRLETECTSAQQRIQVWPFAFKITSTCVTNGQVH
jgi:hypothetical protein